MSLRGLEGRKESWSPLHLLGLHLSARTPGLPQPIPTSTCTNTVHTFMETFSAPQHTHIHCPIEISGKCIPAHTQCSQRHPHTHSDYHPHVHIRICTQDS